MPTLAKTPDMSTPASAKERRRYVILAVRGLVAVPLSNTLISGHATASELVSESDPRAVALKYKMEATQSTERKDPAAVCENCTLYTGKPGDATGTCELFRGGLVTAKGWCTSWEGY